MGEFMKGMTDDMLRPSKSVRAVWLESNASHTC